MNSLRLALLSGALSLAALCVAVPLHAQNQGCFSDAVAEQYTCSSSNCRQTIPTWVPFGHGDYNFVGEYVGCCSTEVLVWAPVYPGCLPAAPQAQAASAPKPRDRQLIYVRTCKGDYKLYSVAVA